MPTSRLLQPWDMVGQLNTWSPSGEYSAERVDECGQACQVMVLRHCAGVWVPAAYLHDLVHGAGEVIGTTFEQLVYSFDLMETRAVIRWPVNQQQIRDLVVSSIDKGYSLVPLRWFDHVDNRDASGNPILHFTCIIGYTDTLIQQAGPWSGTFFTETDEQFSSMFYGGILQVLRKRKLGDH